jgi:hypothetical protein
MTAPNKPEQGKKCYCGEPVCDWSKQGLCWNCEEGYQAHMDFEREQYQSMERNR